MYCVKNDTGQYLQRGYSIVFGEACGARLFADPDDAEHFRRLAADDSDQTIRVVGVEFPDIPGKAV